MSGSKYEVIYADIKSKILDHTYDNGMYLPSENEFTTMYGCSRNTVRRAISHLTEEGFVQSHHGKGVRVIYQVSEKHDLTRYGVNGFKQTAERNGYKVKTSVITLTTLVADARMSQKTHFKEGTELYFIKRIRSVDGVPKMVDTNLLRKDLVPGITTQIAEGSLFSYIENTLGMEIRTIKRSITVEHITEFDEKYLKLDGFNCLAVITSRSYNKNGEMFEYTESRNRPDIFMFNSVSITRHRGDDCIH